MTSDEMREAVARVIAPDIWSKTVEDYFGERALTYRARALAKADAILSMISASPVEGWQPMDTAPKDGTAVLLWLREPYSEAVVRYWNWLIEKWVDRDEAWETGKLVPTHWMPLTAPTALTNNISTGSPAESETSGGVDHG